MSLQSRFLFGISILAAALCGTGISSGGCTMTCNSEPGNSAKDVVDEIGDEVEDVVDDIKD